MFYEITKFAVELKVLTVYEPDVVAVPPVIVNPDALDVKYLIITTPEPPFPPL